MLVAEGHYLENFTGTTRLLSRVNRFRIGDPACVQSLLRHVQPGRAPQRSPAGKTRPASDTG